MCYSWFSFDEAITFKLCFSIHSQTLLSKSNLWIFYLRKVSYLTWMEEARVECLRTVGMSFEELVSAGVDLPVAEMNLRYHRSARMGDDVLVMTRLVPDKVRLNWEYQIRTETDLCVTAVVTLVPVDFEKRKLLRSLPSSLEGAIAKLTGI
jgi:acyl-CoA thioester hydrolase